MSNYISLLLRLFVLLLVPFSGVASAADSHASQPKKLALLIGIDDYKSADIPKLRGAVNDVNLMRGVLIGKFDFTPENIVVLKNEQATHQAIIEAIKTHLIAKAKTNDIVVLHFSGHGSRMRDSSGDEVDEMDETLVAYDSRMPGIFDISDDEINVLLRQLAQKTKNITFIFDSCHSGAADRGGSTVRQIAPDRRTPPVTTDFAPFKRGAEGDTDLRPSNSDYVLISGSLANELSNETEFEGRRHGVLTWYLAAALKAAPQRATYRSVMDQVKSEVSTRFPTQHPQVEGAGQDLVLFGTDKINVKPYVLVEPTRPGKARVEAGKAFGVGKGSTLKVYDPGTADFDGTKPVATLKITDVSDFEAEAEVLSDSPLRAQSRAVLDAVSFGDTSIPIFVEAKQSTQLAKVKQALSTMQAISLRQDETGARLIIKEQDGKLIIQSGDLELLAPPVPATEPDAVSRIIFQIKDIAHWMVAIDLRNPNSGIQLGFEIWRASDSAGTPTPSEVPSGTELSYIVENRHSQPLYIYVLDVSSDGSITLLYPKGEQQLLPVDGKPERRLKMSVPDGQVAVLDVLKVIATLKPIDPSVFPQGPIRAAPEATSSGPMDPLAQFMATALRGTRAAADVTVESDTWVTVQKPIRIRRAGAKLSSFSLHFDDKKGFQDVQTRLVGSRALCTGDDKERPGACERLTHASKDGTVFELLASASTRGTDGPISSGQVFDEAYRIQDQTGARRVEPLLEIQVPGSETERGIYKREILGDDTHDPTAAADDQWSLKQIQVSSAWKKIRDRLGLAEGSEASGIIIAHPDTGYRQHPEIWTEIDGKRPIDFAYGKNYYEGGSDAFDPLLSDRLLDNPGHGTASGSVIVSPPGCQLDTASKCVNGIARGAQLIPLRVHRTVSQFNTRNLSQAIQDVADGNIAGNPRLISIAMGGPPTLTMWKAVKAAEKNGVLIVAASGNNVRTVVWPARFSSTIAVAAGNVHCHPWEHSSRGSAVDIMAPGESVWRATLNEQHEYINAMGKGTTFATGNVAGSAALWLSNHRNDPLLKALLEQGMLTKTFRAALRSSAWRPSSSPGANPPETQCNTSKWDENYGAGILNAAALMDVPLSGIYSRELVSTEDETIPLFASLYPEGTDPEQIRTDYSSLFASDQRGSLQNLSNFETEILYHYTINEDVQRSVDALLSRQRSAELVEGLRRALARQDLSGRLRQTLGQ